MLSFVQSLKGMTSDELAALLVAATRQRVNLPDLGVQLTEALDGMAPPGYEAYPLKIGSALRQMQKDKDYAGAGAMMIWAHSMRAVVSPPLRIHGKAVWAELLRGIPRVADAWINLRFAGLPLAGVVAPEDCEYVPILLDPRIT
ncbi:hypothetical protein G6F32_015949 [Rhizopus arrhizus]|jgi:hypothetical protein|nr:hypothetical protein G6F32_015949 [Rhizopus arrhizus]